MYHLCQIERLQEVKERFVYVNGVSAADQRLIRPIDVGEIEIPPTPEGAAWMCIVDSFNINTEASHVLTVIVRFTVGGAYNQRFLTLALYLDRVQDSRCPLLNIFLYRTMGPDFIRRDLF